MAALGSEYEDKVWRWLVLGLENTRDELAKAISENYSKLLHLASDFQDMGKKMTDDFQQNQMCSAQELTAGVIEEHTYEGKTKDRSRPSGKSLSPFGMSSSTGEEKKFFKSRSNSGSTQLPEHSCPVPVTTISESSQNEDPYTFVSSQRSPKKRTRRSQARGGATKGRGSHSKPGASSRGQKSLSSHDEKLAVPLTVLRKHKDTFDELMEGIQHCPTSTYKQQNGIVPSAKIWSSPDDSLDADSPPSEELGSLFVSPTPARMALSSSGTGEEDHIGPDPDLGSKDKKSKKGLQKKPAAIRRSGRQKKEVSSNDDGALESINCLFGDIEQNALNREKKKDFQSPTLISYSDKKRKVEASLDESKMSLSNLEESSEESPGKHPGRRVSFKVPEVEYQPESESEKETSQEGVRSAGSSSHSNALDDVGLLAANAGCQPIGKIPEDVPPKVSENTSTQSLNLISKKSILFADKTKKMQTHSLDRLQNFEKPGSTSKQKKNTIGDRSPGWSRLPSLMKDFESKQKKSPSLDVQHRVTPQKQDKSECMKDLGPHCHVQEASSDCLVEDPSQIIETISSAVPISVHHKKDPRGGVQEGNERLDQSSGQSSNSYDSESAPAKSVYSHSSKVQTPASKYIENVKTSRHTFALDAETQDLDDLILSHASSTMDLVEGLASPRQASFSVGVSPTSPINLHDNPSPVKKTQKRASAQAARSAKQLSNDVSSCETNSSSPEHEVPFASRSLRRSSLQKWLTSPKSDVSKSATIKESPKGRHALSNLEARQSGVRKRKSSGTPEAEAEKSGVKKHKYSRTPEMQTETSMQSSPSRSPPPPPSLLHFDQAIQCSPVKVLHFDQATQCTPPRSFDQGMQTSPPPCLCFDMMVQTSPYPPHNIGIQATPSVTNSSIQYSPLVTRVMGIQTSPSMEERVCISLEQLPTKRPEVNVSGQVTPTEVISQAIQTSIPSQDMAPQAISQAIQTSIPSQDMAPQAISQAIQTSIPSQDMTDDNENPPETHPQNMEETQVSRLRSVRKTLVFSTEQQKQAAVTLPENFSQASTLSGVHALSADSNGMPLSAWTLEEVLGAWEPPESNSRVSKVEELHSEEPDVIEASQKCKSPDLPKKGSLKDADTVFISETHPSSDTEEAMLNDSMPALMRQHSVKPTDMAHSPDFFQEPPTVSIKMDYDMFQDDVEEVDEEQVSKKPSVSDSKDFFKTPTQAPPRSQSKQVDLFLSLLFKNFIFSICADRNFRGPLFPYRENERKLVFLCSLLQGEAMQAVVKFAKIIGADILNRFEQRVTHVIVHQDPKESVAQITLKFLMGVAHRKWIVWFSWVEESLKAGKSLPEENFEASHAEGEMGPYRARVGYPLPLRNVQISVVEPLENISRQAMEELITVCGGLVVSSPKNFVSGPQIAVVLCLYTADINFQGLSEEYPHALILDQQWVLETVASYRILPIEDYVLYPGLMDRIASMDLPSEYLNDSYFVLVIFICIVELVAVTLALVYQEGVHDGLRAELKEGIKFHYNTTTQHTFDELWDRLQTQFGCCGVDSYEDWYGIHAWPTKSQVPPSCCTPEALQDYGPNNCAVSAEPGHFHTSGCYERLKDWLMERVHIVTIMGVFLAALQGLWNIMSAGIPTNFGHQHCEKEKKMGSSQHYQLKWNNHHANLSSVFDQLLQVEAFTDVTIACDGASLKCHKMVLAACSPYFQKLFLDNPCQHPIVVLKDIKYQVFRYLLDFMYKGEVNISQDDFLSLMKVAKTLKIKGLVESDECPMSTPTSSWLGSGGASKELTSSPASPPIPVPESTLKVPPIPLSLPNGPTNDPRSSLLLQNLCIPRFGCESPHSPSDLSRHQRNPTSQHPILRTALGTQGLPTNGENGSPLNEEEDDDMGANSYNAQESSQSEMVSASEDSLSRDIFSSPQGHPLELLSTSIPMDRFQVPSSLQYTPILPKSGPSKSHSNSSRKGNSSTPREWKRYKLYDRADLQRAIDVVKSGMSATAAAKIYGIPSRTLYAKIKKLGIPTAPRKSFGRMVLNARQLAEARGGVKAETENGVSIKAEFPDQVSSIKLEYPDAPHDGSEEAQDVGESRSTPDAPVVTSGQELEATQEEEEKEEMEGMEGSKGEGEEEEEEENEEMSEQVGDLSTSEACHPVNLVSRNPSIASAGSME
ncbi:unnamed protein product [Darwinula stevensoni]|uniref:Uncharacterized protein n=1 Tax=Darwinula stevensoni TaxID=69355 RepID=A0A7R8X860_9CRUS|nr:unnamed protein product [Darwinula stevensoni]CAG0889783.1 unnamed protein product [Darwinula stevensoni]